MSRIVKSLKSAVRYARGDYSAGRSTLFIEMDAAARERLKQLVVAAEAVNELEVIGTALGFFEACIKEVNQGGKIIIRRADGTEIEAMGSE